MRRDSVLNELRRLYQSDNRQWSEISSIDNQDPNLLIFSFEDEKKASSFYDFVEFHIGTSRELTDCLLKSDNSDNKNLVILEVRVDKEGVYA